MEADASAYDELNEPQTKIGSEFIRGLNLSQGDTVLDMGCGTGDVTKYIADIVGPAGLVVGVDPDAARIKIAEEKYKDISNLRFHVGNSATGFPHDNEPYYDAHISTSAFHWVPNDEKKIYVQKAHQCLKSGGKLAILCGDNVSPDREDQTNLVQLQALTPDDYQQLFEEVGLFPNAVVKKALYLMQFKSFELFQRWAKASTHHDFDELDSEYLKEVMQELVTIENDGTVTAKSPSVNIKASKIWLINDNHQTKYDQNFKNRAN